MSWRVAESLLQLRKQVDEMSPGRVKSSDGTIGDAAHASRSSDHNPWVKDGPEGVVTAIDITHDPKHGVDCRLLSEALVASRDPRIKYIIWNHHIWNPSKGVQWRDYTGANPHDKHMHVSVKSSKAQYDDVTRWRLNSGVGVPDTKAPAVPDLPILMAGAAGPTDKIAAAKSLLITALNQERGFGPLMDALTKAFQTEAGLSPDGKIGAYTWEKMKQLSMGI